MDEKTLVGRDEARKELLIKCETQIAEGKRRGVEAMRMIAKALNKIRDEQYYLDQGYETFNQYCEQRLGMERHTAQHICEAYDTIKTLEAAGITVIPALEKHLVLLNRIPKEELPKAWSEGLQFFTDQGLAISTSNIKRLVEAVLKRQEEPPGVNPELKIDEDDGDGAKKPARSEDAELALERIGRMAGKQTLQAIVSGTVPIHDRDLIKWSEQSDQMVKNLAYYIIGERWSLKRALEYEENSFNEQTTLAGLTLFATARGGEYQSEFDLDNSTWGFYIKKIAS